MLYLYVEIKIFFSFKFKAAHEINLPSIKICIYSRFCLLNVLSLYTYTTAFQKVDDEEFGGTWELIKEGFMTSFASFLVR